MKNRIAEVDFLRSMSIVFILFTHLPSYVHLIDITGIFSPFFSDLGLGMFIFLSGYLLSFNNSNLESFNDAIHFFKKRLLRIYPLYCLSLIFFILTFGVIPTFLGLKPSIDINLFYLLIHFTGTQILLSPRYVIPMFTLWFIGLIFIYYLLFPFFFRYSNNIKKFIQMAILLFVISLLIHLLFNIIEQRFFEYYFIFLLGVLSNVSSFFEKFTFSKYFILSPVLFFISLILLLKLEYSSILLYYFLINILILSFVILQFYFTKCFINSFSNGQKYLFVVFANISYPIYLFHRVVLSISYYITNTFFTPLLSDLCILFLGLPLVFVVSFYIQIFESKFKYHILKPQLLMNYFARDQS